ncbi:MAG: glycerol-3-phosphate 1-O-acyltransferase PlsY [Ruminococcaceae bacterium]|nr:glycerol-3-phosphate 1-O-acyltransferase PlsY [Oscillospiraceae bacterium]
MTDVIILIVCGLIGYLLGSINTSIVLSKVLYKEDIREKGSGNAGTTNALRSYGKKFAAFTLLGDLLKGIVAVLLAWLVAPTGWNQLAGVIAGGAAILGHNFPVYFGFKGGKGVLTTFAVMVVITPVPALIALLIFIALVLVFKYVSLGSMTAAASLPLIVYFRGDYMDIPGGSTPIFWMSVGVALLIIIRHHANIGRLIKGTESKLSLKKGE